MEIDEFEIKAFKSNEEKVWTRSHYDTAKFIADQAVRRLGYERAEVINTFGGVRSDVLYSINSIKKAG